MKWLWDLIIEECSKEYQKYLIDRGYHPSKVKTQFHKAKDTPRADLLSPKEREKKVIFPLVVNFNPHLPNISKIIKSHSHLAIIREFYIYECCAA